MPCVCMCLWRSEADVGLLELHFVVTSGCELPSVGAAPLEEQ